MAVSTIIATPAFQVNPNLLDNWYFVGGGSQQGGGQFPINQRGQTSYSTANAYSIDRWKLDSGSLSVAADGIVYSSSVQYQHMHQTIDNAASDLGGKTVTLSVLYGANQLASATFVWRTTAGQTWVMGFGGFYVDASLNSIYITRTNNGAASITLKAIKLELGNTQTLCHKENNAWVLNEIPNYQQELAKCQRYFLSVFNDGETYSTSCFGISTSATQANFIIPTPVTMRAKPTISNSGAIRVVRWKSDSTTELASVNSFTADYTRVGNCSVQITANTSSNITAGQMFILSKNNSASARLYLSAEL